MNQHHHPTGHGLPLYQKATITAGLIILILGALYLTRVTEDDINKCVENSIYSRETCMRQLLR